MNPVTFCTQFVPLIWMKFIVQCADKIYPVTEIRDKSVLEVGYMTVFDTLDPIRRAIHSLFLFHNVTKAVAPPPPGLNVTTT